MVTIDLNTLEPHINGPFTPDLATAVSDMSTVAKENDWPLKVEWGLIGSCTNSSYEDLSRAASIAKQAVEMHTERFPNSSFTGWAFVAGDSGSMANRLLGKSRAPVTRILRHPGWTSLNRWRTSSPSMKGKW